MQPNVFTSTPFKTYPLKALFASDRNVRKKARTPQDVRSMALSIAAHGGLLQNLVVVPEVKAGKPTGRAGVTAGETRRLALCFLRDGGLPDVEGFTDDYPVPVIEVADEEAVAASATENILRTQMHPADQFEAFRELFDQCGSIEQVADFFGVTPLLVRQRLKLAHAAPKLFELYRQDGMSLEQLMALSITDDQEAQEKLWTSTKGREWDRSPERLRQALTQRELDVRSPVVQFVGLAAYEKEGGRVRQDLFAEQGAGFVIDVELLNRLTAEKLDKVAEPVRREGWGWIEVRAEAFSDTYNYGRANKARRALSEAEQAEIDALEAAIAEADRALDTMYESDDELDPEDPKLVEQQEKLNGAREKLRTLEAKYEAWTPEVLAYAGAIVALDRSGKIVIHRALVRPEDRKAAAKAAANVSRHAGAPDAAVQAAPKAAESEALTRRLTAHRTVALQRVLADNTQVALAALAHNLLQRLMLDHIRVVSALDVQGKGCNGQLDGATESQIQQSPAWVELKAIRDQWGERIPGDQDKLLPWLIGLPMTQLCDLLALCSALTLSAVQARALKHEADPIAVAVGLDMADWWEPTAGEYLGSVSKAQIAKALGEAGLRDEAVAVEKLKKVEAVAKAEAWLAGKGWLPVVLRKPE